MSTPQTPDQLRQKVAQDAAASGIDLHSPYPWAVAAVVVLLTMLASHARLF